MQLKGCAHASLEAKAPHYPSKLASREKTTKARDRRTALCMAYSRYIYSTAYNRYIPVPGINYAPTINSFLLKHYG